MSPSATSFSRHWHDRNVKTKILLGFTLVLTVFTGVSIASYHSQNQVAQSFATFARYANTVSIAQSANQAFGEMRRHAREFAHEGQEAEVEAARASATTSQERLSTGIPLTLHPERRAHMMSMRDKVSAYMADFTKAVDMKHAQQRMITDTLDPIGQKLQLDMEHLVATARQDGHDEAIAVGHAALESGLLLRLNVNKAIARHDQASGKQVDDTYRDFTKLMAALDSVTKGTSYRRNFDAALTLAQTYYAAYQKVAALNHDLQGLVDGSMKQRATEAAADAAFVLETGIADEHRIQQQTENLIATSELLVISLSGAGLVGGLVLAWLIGRAISRPLTGLTAAMRRLAERDWTTTIDYQTQGDEIGQMARAVMVFKDNGIAQDQLADQQAEQIAKQARAEKIAGLIARFDQQVTGALQALASSATELNATASSMAGTAEEASRQVDAVATASAEATNNVQTVAVAAEELTASVNEIGRQMELSTRIAAQAVREAEATTAAVQGLATMARNVDNVVKIISEIAGQTNLLALNATIEAARAGDAGKGFAVVASEVKALANRTAKATEEISQQINEMQSATGASVSRIVTIGGTISEMSKIATAIASAVEEQGAATREIARNVQEAARGTGVVSTNIAGVAQAASETGAAAAQVQATSSEVAAQGENLKREVDLFLGGIKAA